MSVSTAIHIVHDWLGEGGKPVNQELSNHRAMICSACPENVKSINLLKKAIAHTVKEHIEAKNEMKIRTDFDSDLHLCTKCGCDLSLKVHVPIEHIRAYTTDKQLDNLPEFCWQRKELNYA